MALTFGTLLSSQGAGAHLSGTFQSVSGATFLTYRGGSSGSNPGSVPISQCTLVLPSAANCCGARCGGASRDRPLRRISATSSVPLGEVLQTIYMPCSGVKPGVPLGCFRAPVGHLGDAGCSRIPLLSKGFRQRRQFRSTPAKVRRPLRSTSQRPCRKSSATGTWASSETRSLFR